MTDYHVIFLNGGSSFDHKHLFITQCEIGLYPNYPNKAVLESNTKIIKYMREVSPNNVQATEMTINITCVSSSPACHELFN